MKSKKGFTLVELLGVIIILAILMVLLMPIVNNSSSSVRKKTYETKMDLIEDAAVIYGQDNYRSIIDNANRELTGYSTETKDGVTYHIQTIRVKDLIPEYYTADNETETNMVVDPRSNTQFLDEYIIEIRINPNTRKVKAKVQNR